MNKIWCALTIPLLLLVACAGPQAPTREAATAAATVAETPRPDGPPPRWAIAIHGGAGVIPKTMEEDQKQAYFDGLNEALTLGRELLEGGAPGLDVVEQVVRLMEDNPLFNAGKGAVFTHEGTNELDAAIMDGRDLGCGAVSGLTTVKNPISVARLVMERSPHIFFVGSGAESFADEMGVERVKPEYYFTERRWGQLQRRLEQEKAAEEPGEKGTVGCVVLDREGNLAAGTSTGGLTNKRFGRVGDVPVIGAGTYANNRTVAVSCTGKGEQFIRNNVAHDVSALVEYRGLSLQEAAEAVIHGKLDKGDGGLIAVDKDGAVAMVFNSPGMFRGAADADGRFEVKIWE